MTDPFTNKAEEILQNFLTARIQQFKPVQEDFDNAIRALTQLHHEEVEREVEKELEAIRPQMEMYTTHGMTRPHTYMGREYASCVVCGFSPDAMNVYIDNQIEQRNRLNKGER